MKKWDEALMNVLVTGANGFMGAWLVRRLVERTDSVKCLLRARADGSSLEGLPVERVEGAVTDAASLARAVEGVDAVLHLAGIRRSPVREDFIAVNAEGTRKVCEALVGVGGRKKLVLCGSLAAVGPSTPERAHVEEDPFAPHEWYGESKAEAERIALSYRDRLAVTVARPPRILGPGDRENLVFFKLAKVGIRLTIGGGPRPLSLVDVEDVVDFLLLALDRREAEGESFFVTSPEVMTFEGMQDVAADALGVRPRTLHVPPLVLQGLASAADVASRVTGRHLPLNRKLARQLLAPAWTCSGEKAERMLGFRARRGLEESLRRSAAWYRKEGWL